MTDASNATAAGAPRVTMVVTGYNQESMIESAIAGALAQDYQNLEVVLSDDASSDGTYDVMRRVADAYHGPHTLVANRSPQNRGTLGNIYGAVARSSGELILVNCGDDISYPHRASATVEYWKRTGVDALHGRYDVIDEDGAVVERGWAADTSHFWMRDHFPGQTIEPLHGASAAYARTLFERYPLPAERILYEDAFFTLMRSLDRRPIGFVEEPLVMFRRHPESLTNEVPARDADAIVARERKQARSAASQRDLLRLFARERAARGVQPAITPELADDLRLFDARARWLEMGGAERLRALPAARRRRQLDWLLPRLAGSDLFVAAKRAAAGLRSRRAHA